MRPKGKLFALLAVFAAIGLVTATGAFTTVTAARTADVGVAGDSAALVAIQPAPSENGYGGGSPTNSQGYAQISNGQMQISITGFGNSIDGQGVNIDATTDIEVVFNITNQGTQPVSVYLSDSDTQEGNDVDGESEANAVTFYNSTFNTGTELSGTETEYSLEGSSNAVELDPGETLVVSFKVDTTVASVADPSEDLIDEVTITADADVGAASAGPGG